MLIRQDADFSISLTEFSPSRPASPSNPEGVNFKSNPFPAFFLSFDILIFLKNGSRQRRKFAGPRGLLPLFNLRSDFEKWTDKPPLTPSINPEMRLQIEEHIWGVWRIEKCPCEYGSGRWHAEWKHSNCFPKITWVALVPADVYRSIKLAIDLISGLLQPLHAPLSTFSIKCVIRSWQNSWSCSTEDAISHKVDSHRFTGWFGIN